MASTTLALSFTIPTFLATRALGVNSTTPFGGAQSNTVNGYQQFIVVTSGTNKITLAIQRIPGSQQMNVFFMNADGDQGSGSMPIGAAVNSFAWNPVPVGGIPGKPTRFLRTQFDRLPIRGEFRFAGDFADTQNIMWPSGLVWVKTGRSTFAMPAALRAFMGNKSTNTGKVRYWTGAFMNVSSVKQDVFDLNPAFVHQEADFANW